MKKLLSKIPAMIAMVITLFSFFYYAQSFTATEYDVWLLSVIVAMLSMVFYLIDTVISLVKAAKKEDSNFNYLLALVLTGGIPMIIFFAGSGKDYFNVIWNVYYLFMFVLEIISIKKIAGAAKADK